jgi:hypothetical protein
MTTASYRLLKVGFPDQPVNVFVVSKDADGRLWLTDGNLSEPLSANKTLEALETDDLPEWLRSMGHALTLTEVEQVSAEGPAETHRLLMEAAARACRETDERQPAAARR